MLVRSVSSADAGKGKDAQNLLSQFPCDFLRRHPIDLKSVSNERLLTSTV